MSHHHHEPSWYSFERNSRLPRHSFDPPRRSFAQILTIAAGALLALAIVSLL